MMEKFIPDEARIQSVQDNYKKVLSDVKETAIKAGRNPDDVRLMAVTKTVESFYINKVLDLGADLIGENRVQEFLGKKDELHLNGVEKHLIGHLQTNKVKQIVDEVDMIESVDSVHLAKEISKISSKKEITTNKYLIILRLITLLFISCIVINCRTVFLHVIRLTHCRNACVFPSL